MKKHSMPEMKEGGVNVTPLIDIVMCLIIFFMLVAKIGVNTGSDKNIAVPAAFIGKSINDMGNTLTLNVTPGTAGLPTVTAMVGTQVEELKIRDNINGKDVTPLKDTLTYFHDGDPAHGVPGNPDFKVIIRGDKSLDFNSLAPVLSQFPLAHVKTWAFATVQGQRPGSDTESTPDAQP